MELWNRIVQKGLLPKEFPPCFTSASLGRELGKRKSEVERAFPVKTPHIQPATHNLARAGTLRRKLLVPHPWPFVGLAIAVQKHWQLIVEHCNHSKLSRSLPDTSKPGRAVSPRLSLSDLVTERVRARQYGPFLLRADIAQFYPKSYTHSIGWALHGKSVAKRNRSEALPGNELDKRLQACQDGQTTGLPIGPDTSLIMSEVLLCTIDRQLSKAHSMVGFRYMDDWELSFNTEAGAGEARSMLADLIAEFELTLNEEKTSIDSLPLRLESIWASDLSHFGFANSPKQSQSLIRFFDTAFDYAKQHPREYVLNYALGHIRKALNLRSDAWDTLQALLYQTLAIEPGVINHVMMALERYEFPIARETLCAVIEAQIERHAPERHGSELLWCLWAVLRFDLELSDRAAALLGSIDDPFVAILCLQSLDRELLPLNEIPAHWRDAATDAGLLSHLWPLAYEVGTGRFACWQPQTDYMGSNSAMRFMRDNDVTFCDDVSSVDADEEYDFDEPDVFSIYG